MRKIVKIDKEKIIFDFEAILKETGSEEKARPFLDEASSLFFELVSPVGLYQKVSSEEFAEIFHGDGSNEELTPILDIYKNSNHLALFAITLGHKLCKQISDEKYLMAYLLDLLSSRGIELAQDQLEVKFIKEDGYPKGQQKTLRYSPGYCGWSISGQSKLFLKLKPEEIGITLNDSYMMNPVKSMSGVLLTGHKEIHLFEGFFPFCKTCSDRSCIKRKEQL